MILLRRKKVDTSQERKLISNLIMSSRFCKEILPLTSARLLKSENSKTAYQWIQSYFGTYKEAPKGNLEKLFDEAMVTESEATVELVSDFLLDLSEEYEENEEINIKFEVDQAKAYLKRRNIEVTNEEVKVLLERDKIDKAEEVLKKFSRHKESFGDVVMNISSCSINSTTFTKEEIAVPHMILSPWLTDGNISMLYAPRGIGKTWLSLSLAVMITRKNGEGLKIGPWEVRNPSGCLYVDGEMGEYELQDRLKTLEKMYGEESEETPLTILAASRYAKAHGAQINISTEEYRNAIYQYLFDNDKYYLLILDNIASLTPGIKENSKEDWDPINQWLISLRHLGVSVLLIHHSGKGNAQRGTSGREDALDCVINLRRPGICGHEHGARFSVGFEKSRNIAPGPGLVTFDLHLLETGSGGLEWKRIYKGEEDD